MPKPTISINFSQGLNTKVDPWQIPIGQFEVLENSVFQIGGLLKKRNGYGKLADLSPNRYLTTLNENLVSIGNTVSAYSSSLNGWITKGNLQPCGLSVLPLIRNNLNQTQIDCAVANGFVCSVFTETNNSTSAVVTQYLYAVADSVTGQNIVAPSSLPVIAGGTISGSSRVFIVGNFFVIVSQVIVAGTTSLQYCSIPITNPINLLTNVSNISIAKSVCSDIYVPISSNPGWDGAVANNTLVIAYNTTTGAQGVHVTSLTSAQIAANQTSAIIHSFNNAAYVGALVSVCVDLSVSPNIFYISFWNNSTTNGYTCAVRIGFASITTQFTPQLVINTVPTANLASAAQDGSCGVFFEVINSYSYDSTIPTNRVNRVDISSAGVVGANTPIIRSVGLASKAFVVDGTMYFLSAHQSAFQPSYFLINGTTSTQASPVIVSKLAYQNGGGYLARGLPGAAIDSDIEKIPYLFKDSVEALNTENNPQQLATGGIYSQLGINLASFEIGTQNINSAEIASNLHISGGYLSHFDGYLPVEHNFFLFPENVELTYTANSVKTPTGTASNGSTTIVVSSATGLSPGMTITDTSNAGYIPAGTKIVLVNGTTITMSAATTHAIAGDNLSIQGNIAAVPTGASVAGSGLYYYQATYEWTDNQGFAYRSAPSIPVTFTTSGSATTGIVQINVPTLRLTAKVANKVKIVIYRWSEATQVYNQVTSISAPVLNDTTVDSVSFVDTLADSDVVGNNIIYTTGGVAADTNGPACNGLIGIFNSGIVMMDAENPNTAWISKTVVPGAPVEMSQGFTIYVSPTQGVIKSLGPVTATAPMDDKYVFFFSQGLSYINGSPPNALGTTSVGCSLGNYSQPVSVVSSVGCTNQKSIVMTPLGLMFQSDKGIWLLDRFKFGTSYIGAPVEKYNNSVVTSANIIPKTTFVLFTLDSGQILMYDYYYNQWGTFAGVRGVSSCIYNTLHTLLDQYGNILQETPGLYLDNSSPVLMGLKTGWINVAGIQGYERFYWFYLLGQYLSPHFINCGIAYNYNPSLVSNPQVSPFNFSSAEASPFGDQSAPFGSPYNLENWLIHSQYQKCQSFQITLQEQFNPIFGTTAGPGFTLSGLNIVASVKRGSRPISQSVTTG